jgi:ankyrin repeat protein
MSFKLILVVGLMTSVFALPARAQKEPTMNEEFFNAITQGNLTRVKQMLKAEPGLAGARDQNGLSAILKATYHRQKDIVSTLLEVTSELNIFEAAATGQTNRVRTLLKQDSSSVKAYSADGFAPLGLAVFFGHPETVEALLSGGANVNAVSRESMQVRPLNSAAAAGQTAIAGVLLAHGADVNGRATNNITPLHEAAANGDLAFVKLLLAHGADVNAETTDGKTPLSLAREHQRTEVVALLQAHRAK